MENTLIYKSEVILVNDQVKYKNTLTLTLYSKYDYIRGSVGVLWFSASGQLNVFK